ncbi:MAG: methyl-accepting chemotaxis protein [Planctomycetes bacterium]|nr:methyl-accepting chemotaxis protein [Planctomycetota bacterium]
MKLRTRLTTAFLCCGLVPLLVATAVSYRNSSSGMRAIEENATADLEKKSKDQLVALRDSKKEQIERYFSTIRDQMLTFSEDTMVVAAMKKLPGLFDAYREEANVDADLLAEQRGKLLTYYTNEFSTEYRNQNGGTSPNAEQYFQQLDDDSVALQYAYIRGNMHPLGSKHMLDTPNDATNYSRFHEQTHPVIRSYLEKFGYYDIFLVDSNSGDIVYSVFKELDYSTSLQDGPYADTNFGEAFRKANAATDKDAVFLVDFKQYTPSYEAPASFIASPIFEGDTKVGVAIFQMPIDRINGVMAFRSGMGDTGESYLVGPDKLMRCDTYRDPEHRSIIASFKAPDQGSVDTEAVSFALKGEAGVEEVTNYLGDTVVCAYTPVDILGLQWALLAEITTEEAYQAARGMRKTADGATTTMLLWNSIVAIIAVLSLVAVAVFTSAKIVRPINRSVAMLKDIAEGEGDLTKRLDASRRDEFGELAGWFNTFVEKLQTIISDLAQNAQTLNGSSTELSEVATTLATGATDATQQSGTVAAAAEEMSVNMGNMARSTEEVSGNVGHVATAVDEMTTSIREVAENAERSASVAAQAATLVGVSNTKIADLGSAADEIGKVIEVIQDIAEQTNLLALNATIEAARAGEAGKGFAVVATEVKELAKQTATATDDIRRRIEGIQGSTGEAVDAIQEISTVINNVNEVSRTIAAAVEEQSITTKQIAQNVSQTASAAELVAKGVNESATASQEITQSIARVDQILRQTASGANQSQSAGNEFSELAEQMQALVSQFKTSTSATSANVSQDLAC